jgi:hypothetical protein
LENFVKESDPRVPCAFGDTLKLVLIHIVIFFYSFILFISIDDFNHYHNKNSHQIRPNKPAITKKLEKSITFNNNNNSNNNNKHLKEKVDLISKNLNEVNFKLKNLKQQVSVENTAPKIIKYFCGSSKNLNEIKNKHDHHHHHHQQQQQQQHHIAAKNYSKIPNEEDTVIMNKKTIEIDAITNKENSNNNDNKLRIIEKDPVSLLKSSPIILRHIIYPSSVSSNNNNNNNNITIASDKNSLNIQKKNPVFITPNVEKLLQPTIRGLPKDFNLYEQQVEVKDEEVQVTLMEDEQDAKLKSKKNLSFFKKKFLSSNSFVSNDNSISSDLTLFETDNSSNSSTNISTLNENNSKF